MKKSKAHKKIMISIPIELDNLITKLVDESKSTAKPLTKSALFVVSAYEYLYRANMILKQSKKEEIN
jgi:hypothetical protein